MTQIATNQNQSARLTACGVDPKSADMCYVGGWSPVCAIPFSKCNKEDTPAWSLSKLLALLPMEIRKDGIDFAMMLKSYPNEEECYRWCVSYYDSELELTAYYSEAPDPIEACVMMVEKLTDNGYKLNEIEQ